MSRAVKVIRVVIKGEEPDREAELTVPIRLAVCHPFKFWKALRRIRQIMLLDPDASLAEMKALIAQAAAAGALVEGRTVEGGVERRW